ncbi:MAG: transporter substrate-binding domain-containing protein [Desulfobacter sp.]|nr:MAG: transporter substrate-binding domain-containing protein [Desulfobacter sp.]
MKKVFSLCLCLLLPALTALAGEDTLLITTNEAPPYSGTSLKNQGVSIEIVKQAFKKSGYKVQIRFFPWKRALQMTRKGLCDGITPIWFTEKRTQWLNYSDRLHTPSLIGMYAPSGTTAVIKTYRDLRPYHIGYVMGYAYDRTFYDNLPDFAAIYFYSPFDLMKALVSGKIELAVMEKHQGAYFLHKKFPDSKNKFRFLEPVIEKRMHYLAISKKTENSNLKLEAFNKGLAALIKEGTLRKILAAHHFEKM